MGNRHSKTVMVRRWSLATVVLLWILQACTHQGVKPETEQPLPITTPDPTSEARKPGQELEFAAPGKPGLIEPEAVEPEVIEPEAVEPEVIKPEVVEIEVVEPEATPAEPEPESQASAPKKEALAPEPAVLPVEPQQSAEPEQPVILPDPPEATPESAPGTPAATLDLDSLETRLRKTKAIGFFTKLEIKGQVDNLIDDFSNYHGNRGKLTLDQLEERFGLLLMKLSVLLQDDDPGLQREITSARSALWPTLSNPDQFAALNGPCT